MGKKFVRPSSDASIDAPKSVSKKGSTTTSPNQGRSADQAVGNGTANRPSAKAVVANASWTGKLPTTLLQEYCQKQKWQRPDYSIGHRKDEFIVTAATFSKKNPKNQEVQTAQLKPQRDEVELLQKLTIPTALEARNFAATWALHRVASRLNFSMQLPPAHKRLWQDLEAVRKGVSKDNAGRYATDPFEAAQRAAKQTAHGSTTIARPGASSSPVTSSSHHGADGRPGHCTAQHSLFRNAIEAGLSKEMRQRVTDMMTTLYSHSHLRGRIKGGVSAGLAQSLTQLGFRREHAEEAASLSFTTSEALEFLMLFVPEDDLPPRFLPPSQLHSVSAIAAGEHALKYEYGAKLLASFGYDLEQCRASVRRLGDVPSAWATMQHALLEGQAEVRGPIHAAASCWQEECRTTQDIYGHAVPWDSDSLTYSTDRYTLHVRPSMHGAYPDTLPLIGVEWKSATPSYLRLGALRKLLVASRPHLGEGLLFSIIDLAGHDLSSWVQEVESLLPASISGSQALVAVSDPQKTNDRNGRLKAAGRRSRQRLSKTPRLEVVLADDAASPSRKRLPAWQSHRAVLQAIAAGRVCVISGETGSGKSTQVAQYLLDSMAAAGDGVHANIVCTQPRRISAIALADRVGAERGSTNEVSYSVRGDSRRTRDTKLEFVTIGVLLRRLTVSGEDALAATSHVIIDEVHERSVDSDFLLIILRDLLKRLPHLKVILMSATINAALFQDYFGGCAHVHIEGRTFPVTSHYVDDMDLLAGERFRNGANIDLIEKITDHICSDYQDDLSAAVLVFMPGVAEISACVSRLRRPGLHVLPLHASLPTNEQRLVFQKAPRGTRKVVVATNVAETSITIDDVVFVIDSGRVKQLGLNDGATVLSFKEDWCSQAASRQRRGRAGRVRAGVAFLCYSRALEEAKMPRETQPEILRTPLEQVCLTALAMDKDPATFLSQAISSPSTSQLDSAITLLTHMGALNADGLTNLGRMMSMIPCDLRVGKFLVLASVFDVLAPALQLSACLSCKSPVLGRPDWQESHYDLTDGDLFVALQAYNGWQNAGRERHTYAQTNALHEATLREITSTMSQYQSAMADLGMATDSTSEGGLEWSTRQVLKALLASAFNPNVARIQKPAKVYAATIGGAIEKDPEARSTKFFTKDDGRVFLHPSSVLFHATFPDADFVSFSTKTMTSKLFLSTVTPCSTYGMLLLCNKLELDAQGRGLLVDDWVRIAAWPKIALYLNLFRQYMDALLARKLDGEPSTATDQQICDLMRALISTNGST